MSDVTTTIEARQFIEDERQQRAAAFWQALQSIQKQYNCTVTAMPAWTPLAGGTFTLACEVRVVIGDEPPMEEKQTAE